MIDLVGKSFGKYRIAGELGRGGMAIVYKAVDTVLGRTVAIKVLPPQLGLDADPLKRFHREAQLAAQLDHPGIVPIHDIGEQDGLHFIVMKFLEGKNLNEIMEKQGALPVPQAVTILRQVASALDYAHGRGIIHRDIKPSNVIVGPDGHATLTDFGIARAVAGARLTQHSMTIGTPGYMSPEQFDGAELDYRSDLFSLGVTACEMLTGRVAYAGTTPEAVLKARFTTEPPSPRPARPITRYWRPDRLSMELSNTPGRLGWERLARILASPANSLLASGLTRRFS
jgi:serine/threonine-protein kinase